MKGTNQLGPLRQPPPNPPGQPNQSKPPEQLRLGVFSLITNSTGLFLSALNAALVYAFPAMLALFFAVFALLWQPLQDQLHYGIVLAIALLFAVFNTLFVYAASEQMLKPSASIDVLYAFAWRRRHNDFFIFIMLEVMAIVFLALYFVDLFGYLQEQIDVMSRERGEYIRSRGGKSMAADSYSIFIVGAKVASLLLLLLAVWGWGYICRAGIRIPAHVEGYYLRASEARELTRAYKLRILLVSLLFLLAVTGLSSALFSEADRWYASQPPAWILALIWTFVYFVCVLFHVALWVSLYVSLTRVSAYHMSRMRF